MDFSILIIFLLVYLGMILGNWPGFALDRSGIALLGAIALILVKNLSTQEAFADIDFSSIAILFSFMIISAQLYFSGFYTYLTEKVEKWKISPDRLLLVIIVLAGILSAGLINDIVCLAMTPLLIQICQRKNLNPVPFLLGLACGSNIGSGLTLVGNPQNILIGQALHIPFAEYTIDAAVPCFLGFFVSWWVIQRQVKGSWYLESLDINVERIKFDAWQSYKGIIVILLLFGIFILTDISHEHVSLIAAGYLLLSQSTASRKILGFIDWQLLVLFIGLFIVNREFNRTEFMHSFLEFLQTHQVILHSPYSIFIISAVLSNVLSAVPTVMLLLPFANTHLEGTMLALSSTFAGNIFIMSSIANIIVITEASYFGIRISWKKHLTVGLPIGLVSLAITALWMHLRYNPIL